MIYIFIYLKICSLKHRYYNLYLTLIDQVFILLFVYPCVWLHADIGVLLAEVGVNLLDKVGPVLIAAVNPPLQRKCLQRLYVRVANDILEVPLYGVYPTFQVKPVLDGVPVVGIVDRRIDIVRYVVVSNGLIENQVAMFCE